ncbi:MAG: 4-hydroxybenzoate octaprenyltransferase, partial [Nitrospinaceae bacterium]|nr:4-hydroxybenzoate octaprenyltransferase [Nitrospinaceae bacterium]
MAEEAQGGGIGAALRQFMRMVKFEHTIFGLPF